MQKPSEEQIKLLQQTEYDRAIIGYRILVNDAIDKGLNKVFFFGCEDKRLHEERVIALTQIYFALEKDGWFVLKNIKIPLKMKWRKDRPWNWYEKFLYGI